MTVMTIEFGIWSDAAGGIVESQMHSPQEAAARLAELVADGEDADDLKVVPMCEDHEEQPKYGCEECDTPEREMCEAHPDQPADECAEC